MSIEPVRHTLLVVLRDPKLEFLYGADGRHWDSYIANEARVLVVHHSADRPIIDRMLDHDTDQFPLDAIQYSRRSRVE